MIALRLRTRSGSWLGGALAGVLLLGAIALWTASSVGADQQAVRSSPRECDPPPYPIVAADSTAASSLARLASTMRAIADSVDAAFRQAIGNQHPAFEGPRWVFHESVLETAEVAVQLNPHDARARVLYGEWKWLLAPPRGPDQCARDSAEAREAYRQLVCGRALAEDTGDTTLILHAQSLLRWIGTCFDHWRARP